jgi:hypothetical protein
MPSTKKIFKNSILLIGGVILVWIISCAWITFPVISGFGANQMCSCMFVSGRTERSVDTSELGDFPFTISAYKVDLKDSSVIGSVFGMAKKS